MSDASLEALIKGQKNIMQELLSIKTLTLANLRRQHPRRDQLVLEELQRKGRLNTSQIRQHFGFKNRRSVHDCLERLGKQPGVTHLRGDAATHRQSALIYSDEKRYEDQLLMMWDWTKKYGAFRLTKIIETFSISDDEARDLVALFCKRHPEYHINPADGFTIRLKAMKPNQDSQGG